MYPLHNPDSYTSIEDLANTTNFSSTQFPSNKQMRTNPIEKKPSTFDPSSTKSVSKFKRTNPSLHQIKPNPASLHKNTNLISDKVNQQYQQNFQNLHFNHPILKLNVASSLTTSRQTVQTIQYPNHNNYHVLNQTQIYSTGRNPLLFTDRNSHTLQKYSTKNQDLLSLKSFKSGKSSKKGSKPDNQNYTIYWKKKAHQYLENNFKLSEEIQKLKKKLSKYEDLQQKEISQKNNCDLKSEKIIKKYEERSVPLHIVQLQQRKYIHQIDQLSISSKVKDSMIQNLQNKIIELNQQVRGEKEKSDLMQKMRQQVEQLENKNRQLKRDLDPRSSSKREQEKFKTLQETQHRKQIPFEQAGHGFGGYKLSKDLQKLRHQTLKD